MSTTDLLCLQNRHPLFLHIFQGSLYTKSARQKLLRLYARKDLLQALGIHLMIICTNPTEELPGLRTWVPFELFSDAKALLACQWGFISSRRVFGSAPVPCICGMLLCDQPLNLPKESSAQNQFSSQTEGRKPGELHQHINKLPKCTNELSKHTNEPQYINEPPKHTNEPQHTNEPSQQEEQENKADAGPAVLYRFTEGKLSCLTNVPGEEGCDLKSSLSENTGQILYRSLQIQSNTLDHMLKAAAACQHEWFIRNFDQFIDKRI